MDTIDKVTRLVKFATGEDYGDGMMVTDVITGYAEPGYGSSLSDETPVVVLGNWNVKRYVSDGEPPFTPAESLPARLAKALERVGAQVEWLDEWTSCHSCFRAVRTEPDSYGWKPYFVWTDDGPVCADCAIAGGEDYLTEYIGEVEKCVTWCEPSHVESFGFAKWAPGDEHTYESGWRPGQGDDPEAITAEILAAEPDAEIIFFLDSSGQFDIRFSAYVRVPAND